MTTQAKPEQPNERTIAVLSQGCAANFGDGERIARMLANGSPDIHVTFQFPDCAPAEFFLNVCTVKGNAGAIKLLRKAHETFPGTPITITGCAPRDFVEEARGIVPGLRFTTVSEMEREFGANLNREVSSANLNRAGFAANLNRTGFAANLNRAENPDTLRESPFVGIVNIEEGCLDACAFCSTHLVRGRLHSRPQQEIVTQVGRLVADGCKEIQLTGQDCACYGFDCGTNLAELVQAILAHVPGSYKVRLGMGNPRHVKQYREALLDCFADERLYRFIHIPVQSGSDRVLQAMGRRHNVEDYRELARAFAERFERFTLSTDIIVGFPGETEADYLETERIVKETRPTVCNITRFVARPGTPAYRFEHNPNQEGASGPYSNNAGSPLPVPDAVKHERSARLAEVFQQVAHENNRNWIGCEETVVTEKPGYRAGTTIARNAAYRPVAIAGTIPAGRELRVRITGAEPFALIGEPL